MANDKDQAPKAKASTDIEPAKPNKLAELSFVDLKSLLEKAKDDAVTNPAEIEERIFQQMLQANSLEELLTPQQVISWRDILDEPVTVKSVRFNESDFGDGDGIYAVIDGEIGGKPVVLSCGARTPMIQLLIAQHQGWLPARLILTQSLRKTAAGYYPLNMLPAPAQEDPF